MRLPTLSLCIHFTALVVAVSCTQVQAQTGLDPRRVGDSLRGLNRGTELEWGTGDMAPQESGQNIAEASPADDDLGVQAILHRPTRNRNWKAQLGNSLLWTDNVANAAAGERSDWFWQESLQLSYQKQVSDNWLIYGGASEQLARYDEFTELDFEQVELRLGTGWVLPKLANSLVRVEFGYQRYTQGEWAEPIYENYSCEVGWDALKTFNPQWSLGYGVAARLSLAAEPELLQRHEYDAHTTLQWRLLPELSATLAGRAAWHDYQHFANRADWFFTGSVGLVWSPTPALDIALSYGWTRNASNLAAFDFQSGMGGPSILCKLSF